VPLPVCLGTAEKWPVPGFSRPRWRLRRSWSGRREAARGLRTRDTGSPVPASSRAGGGVSASAPLPAPVGDSKGKPGRW